MNIRTTCFYKDQWTAFDVDTYDGAPDARAFRTCGLGNTKAAAIEDLIQQFENGTPWQQEMALEYRASHRDHAALLRATVTECPNGCPGALEESEHTDGLHLTCSACGFFATEEHARRLEEKING